MAWRFRRSLKLLPGVRLNLSKGGTSLSLGSRGATLNVSGKRGVRATVGLPGTGLSVSERLDSPTPASSRTANDLEPDTWLGMIAHDIGVLLYVLLSALGIIVMVLLGIAAALFS